MALSATRQGFLFALAAYLIWGIAPVYFKYMAHIPADEIVTHRIIWSFIFMLILLTLARRWPIVRHACRNKKQILLLAITATVIAGNWLLFIWAVNNNHMLETSMGYFITPIVNMLMGMVFLGERFRRMQWVALALACCAVLVQVWYLGTLPSIGLGLAISFSLYGLLRKKIGIDAQTGMLIETLWLLPLAICYLQFFADSPTSNLTLNSWQLNLLLAAAGVITTVPLLCFTAAATRLPLSTLGFFQYLGPSITLLLAIFVYGEVMTFYTVLTFIFIWLALFIFVSDAILYKRKHKSINQA